MIYLFYFILAAAVILFATRLSYYIDLLDKTTGLSGAFLGGVMLAAVTSIPELITSITAVAIVKQPDMVIGNILGSNLFNITVLGALMLFGMKKFKNSSLAFAHKNTCYALLVVTVLVSLVLYAQLEFQIFTVSWVSIAIMAVYLFAVRKMSSSEGEEENDPLVIDMSTKQIVIRFIINSILLVVASVLITIISDQIAADLGLGKTFAGALLLAVATSLPELASSIGLVFRGNFNATVGNIVGSNLFNFTILFVSDLFLVHGTIYDQSGVSLLVYGSISTIVLTLLLLAKSKQDKLKPKLQTAIYSVGAVLCTAGYLVYLAFH
ncbi:sodium:calcium antiporter [Massilioclostridium coli]|uniref:sodium:calcium antiporter n=1 Tax=Massilioclostridium coli TaxID=1870991 RepID=UPI0022DECAC0|nr:cation transporter [Massilioclostridium coli]